MSNVLIVTVRESMEYPLEQISGGQIHCHILPPTEVQDAFSVPTSSRPDLMVVDLSSVKARPDEFVDELSRVNPEASIIILSDDKAELSGAISSHFAVDEIIRCPEDGKQKQVTMQELANKIVLFERLHAVQEKLRKEMHQQHIVVRSESMREMMSCLPQLAETSSTILITGETGTGKELIARAIHYLGTRAGRPFITVDCGTIPETLVENELFGHARGAYTDATGGFRGLIQEADGGTLFLDEVESIPLCVQTKLLRFLQERQYKPLGQSNYVSVDVHVVAATNVDLIAHIGKKLFREDLYYRLKVIPLTIPPLRERRVDIPGLVRYFLRRYAGDRHTAVDIAPEVLRQWMEYDWPGNVRELENKIQEWLMMADAGAHFAPTRSTQTADLVCTLSEVRRDALARSEGKYFRHLMSITNGNISAAARIAKVDRKNLRRLLTKYSIDPEGFRPKH